MIADDLVRGNGGQAAGVVRPARPLPLSHIDASDPGLLPEGKPMDMPEQDFSQPAARLWPRRRGPAIPRTAVFLGAGLMTAAFAYELYGGLAAARIAALQLRGLVLWTLPIAWIGVGPL